MTRVISYTRFSSKKQAKGNSYVRQTKAAAKWCKDNNYELDPISYEDLGVSGFSGANVATGALGVLLAAAKRGDIEKGSIVLIEAFDRLTREDLTESVPILMSIVNAGITLITLDDEKKWNKKTLKDMTAFITSIALMYRGHEESKRKASNVRKAFRTAREEDSQKPFGVAPGWLYRDDQSSRWSVNEDLAAVVVKVFEKAAAGLGSKAIAKIANSEKWPVPLRLNLTEGRWHGQMPNQILRNRAVLGEHEHRIATYDEKKIHWRGTSSGIEKKDYYPRIISDELWYRARASIETRSIPKRRDTHYFNIFSGLMFCGTCGATMHRKTDSDKSHTLVCSHKAGNAENKCVTMKAKNADIPLLRKHPPRAVLTV